MSRPIDRATKWMYRGVWGVLTEWFRVPDEPPTLPTLPGEEIQCFRPAPGFLRYLKLQFLLSFVVFDFFILAGWLAITAARPGIGMWLTPLALVLAVVPAVVSYLAICLRYDTTWYVLSRRSLRIRGGIWVIHEATITFENVQNVTVESGPIERWFGIGNVMLDTAGGGQGGKDAEGHSRQNLHRGEIAGVSNAPEIRQLILKRLLQSKSAGLGDESHVTPHTWSTEYVAVLREIRDSLKTA